MTWLWCMIHLKNSSPGSNQYLISLCFPSIAEDQNSAFREFSINIPNSFSKRQQRADCQLLPEQWSFCHFPSVLLLCPSQSWLSTGIWSPNPSAGHEWDLPEILWQFWRVLHYPQTWLTRCLSHLCPKSNDPIWLTHWRIPTHPHCFLDRSSSMRELQPFFIHSLAPQCAWGKVPFLESWMCFISDALLRHILTHFCKACQQIWKACISPIKATFLPNKSNISFLPPSLSCTQDPSMSNMW